MEKQICQSTQSFDNPALEDDELISIPFGFGNSIQFYPDPMQTMDTPNKVAHQLIAHSGCCCRRCWIRKHLVRLLSQEDNHLGDLHFEWLLCCFSAYQIVNQGAANGSHEKTLDSGASMEQNQQFVKTTLAAGYESLESSIREAF